MSATHVKASLMPKKVIESHWTKLNNLALRSVNSKPVRMLLQLPQDMGSHTTRVAAPACTNLTTWIWNAGSAVKKGTFERTDAQKRRRRTGMSLARAGHCE